MKISEILHRKGHEVEVINPRVSLADANILMTGLNIGAVVVCDLREGYLGVLSERDILRRISAEGASALDGTAGDALTGRPISCRPDDDVRSVMKTMTYRRIRHVPVVVDGEVRGIVSIGDIVKELLGEVELEVNVLRDYARSH